MLLADLDRGVERWRAHADVVGLSVPWYGLDHAEQIALFRDVLHALERMP